MKKDILRKSVSSFIALIFAMSLVCTNVLAHSSSQEGILERYYDSKKQLYFIGSEEAGWLIDESCHTNGTSITYSFDTSDMYLTDTYKSYTTTGASKWSGTVTITNKEDGTGQGKINTYHGGCNSISVAEFCNYSANSSGHLTKWEISINRDKTANAVTLAHEFGHAIGLSDLYASKNSDKLMYGYATGTATRPTTADKWGAKVITGVHSSHTWGYKYLKTTSTGNVHVKYCTVCSGISTVSAPCVYNANNVCKICGIPKGQQTQGLTDTYFLKQAFYEPVIMKC